MIDGIITQETEKPGGLGAFLVQVQNEPVKAEWIPKSTVEYLLREEAGKVPTKCKIRIAMWKVQQLGWRDFDDR